MDENQIFERLLNNPETYRSMLGASYGRNTETVILRRKILRNIHSGNLGRVYLNGSRGFESLIYNCHKKYSIIITMEHRDFHYFCCDTIEKVNNNIKMKNVRELEDFIWVKRGEELNISLVNVIKIV